MNDDDRDRFGVAIGLLGETFNRGISAALAEVHWRAMREFPIGLVERAAEHITQQDGFFPVPSRWREVALEVRREQAEVERRERAQGHELPQDAGTWEEHREQVKLIIDDLGVKLAWPRPGPAPQKRHLRRVMGREG